MPDVHGDDPAVAVEGGEAPAAVGAAGEPIARQIGGKIARDRVGRRERAVPVTDREGGHVYRRAPPREIEGFVEEAYLAVHVGGMKHARRDLGRIERAADEVEAARAVSQ